MFTLQKPMGPQEHKQQTLLWAGSASQQIVKIYKSGSQNYKTLSTLFLDFSRKQSRK